jgi:hypothetical protein
MFAFADPECVFEVLTTAGGAALRLENLPGAMWPVSGAPA